LTKTVQSTASNHVASPPLQLRRYTQPFPLNVRRTTHPTIRCWGERRRKASNTAVTGMRPNGPVMDDGSAVETVCGFRFAKRVFQTRWACVEAVQAKYRRRQDPTVRQRQRDSPAMVDGAMESYNTCRLELNRETVAEGGTKRLMLPCVFQAAALGRRRPIG
jgi:hypothetical protein